jgi:hypothetical protein
LLSRRNFGLKTLFSLAGGAALMGILPTSSTMSADAFDKRTLWIGNIPPMVGPRDLHEAM